MIHNMEILVINTEADYDIALAELHRLWGAEIGTPEGDRLDALMDAVEAYEVAVLGDWLPPA